MANKPADTVLETAPHENPNLHAASEEIQQLLKLNGFGGIIFIYAHEKDGLAVNFFKELPKINRGRAIEACLAFADVLAQEEWLKPTFEALARLKELKEDNNG